MMSRLPSRAFVPTLLALTLALAASAAPPPPAEIISKMLESDPWGLSGAEVTAHAVMKDKRDSSSTLAFTAISYRYDGPLAKSLVRFSAPPDLAGAGFLQTQKKEGDDDRWLFLPELKRSRRIAGSLRTSAFMGTDFSFADLDRRDIRDGKPTILGEENIGKYPCWHLAVVPGRSDSEYSRIELWIREDNFLPLKYQMFDKSQTLFKTLTAEEVKRISGHWFITKSTMVNLREGHSTQLSLDSVTPRDTMPDDQFTQRNLEKL